MVIIAEVMHIGRHAGQRLRAQYFDAGSSPDQ